jgi:peptide deformylase
MDIVTLGNDILRQKAEPIEEINEEIVQLAADMIARLNPKEGIGLAGPQVGVNKRIFIVHIEDDEPRVFINPSIINTSEDEVFYEEGCLSIPGVWADVKRPSVIQVQAWNEKGKAFRVEASGIMARVIQHEYDHLEGILFVDRLSEVKRSKLLDKYEKKKKA